MSAPPAPRSTPTAPGCLQGSATTASLIAATRATLPATWTRSCPGRTWFPRCSNGAPFTIGSTANTCPTTSTSSPSGSAGGPPEPAGCCSTGAPTGRWHRPASPQRAHRRHRQRPGQIHRRPSVNCTQADMQEMCSILIRREPRVYHIPTTRRLTLTQVAFTAQAAAGPGGTVFAPHRRGADPHSSYLVPPRPAKPAKGKYARALYLAQAVKRGRSSYLLGRQPWLRRAAAARG
jgi:hypothetical protein